MAEPQGLNVRMIVTIGIVSILLLTVSVVGVQAWFYNAQEAEQNRKIGGDVYWDLANLRLEQQEKINRYRWVDQPKGQVSIPIDRAIELTARRLAGGSSDQG